MIRQVYIPNREDAIGLAEKGTAKYPHLKNQLYRAAEMLVADMLYIEDDEWRCLGSNRGAIYKLSQPASLTETSDGTTCTCPSYQHGHIRYGKRYQIVCCKHTLALSMLWMLVEKPTTLHKFMTTAEARRDLQPDSTIALATFRRCTMWGIDLKQAAAIADEELTEKEIK